MRLSDVIAHAARQLSRAGVCIGHSHDNALDEARSLVEHALHLPNRLPAAFADAALTADEVIAVEQLIQQRIHTRQPAAYLIGHAEFAGLRLRSDARALVPRSPIAELIVDRYAHWFGDAPPTRILDLCTGGGSIGLATAVYLPDVRVDAADLSPDALALAAENAAMLGVTDRIELIQSDGFAALTGRRYDLIVSNPPYITDAEYAAMPAEYAHEPKLGLTSGVDGLDLPLRILAQAADHLEAGGWLILEVGEASRALRRLLPTVPFKWIEFSVGQMGVCAISATALRASKAQIVVPRMSRSPH